ncbi:ORF V: Enzymatic polyprotein [Labeo rohita]|uniref:ribonuclease H n=1 Tax=Labeo rohita TaxID=84645 RepID=A0ABQ8L2K7_LABRO|nr:ORF V: Enzymatic polyprotein [Labeo rohita]
MPFRLCPTGCGFYLSPNDRHERCVQCLGREHADAAFAEGGCQHCEDMPLGTLRSRAAFFSKKPRRSSSASRSGPSTSGYEAVAMCVEEERQVLSEVLPVASSQTAHPVCLPIESPDDFESSSQYGLDLLFGAPAEEKAASVASEGEPSEADVTTEFAAPAVESQSVADAEMAAALQRAAKEIGVAWVPPPSPEPSRLDDWFLGRGRDSKPRSSPVPFFPEVHEELTKSWKAPLSARSRYANSPSLTTLDGGPARGYSEVPQVERAVAMHLCPQNAASWRGRPRLPSRACKFSSALVAKAYAASGQAASALHAMAILQVYQAKVLKDLHEGAPDPELLHELRSATDYALRATKVTAQALGRAMSTMVVQERHLWLNLAEMRDAEKVRFLDAPISQAGLFGETVEEFAQQFSTRVPAQLSRRSSLRLLPAVEGPLRGWLRPRSLPGLQPDPPNGPALVGRWHRQLVLRPLRTPGRFRSVPETGSPGRRDRLACPDPHSTRGRALDSASTRLSATRQTATTWSTKEQFSPSLGILHSTPDPPLDGRMLSPPFRACGHTPSVLPHALEQRAWSDDLPCRVDPLLSSHGSVSLGKAASGLRGFLPPTTRCFPSEGSPTLGTSNVTPLRPLAENFLDWLNLPNPSRWLLKTIRLGYAIQFARRPPKFCGVLTTSVQGSNTAVLRAEIAVLLAKGAIETVPSAEMKKGFYSPYFIVPKRGGGLRPILDLRVLNRALLKLPFKMLTLKHILTYVRFQDWFVAIDLKDAYFHVSILPRHRPFLRFAFEGRAYQYKVLPFGLSLSPVFTKGNGHSHSQLSRRLADPGSLVGYGLRTQGHGSQPFGSLGASGQLGKEQTLPGTEDLFSRCRTGLGRHVCTSLPERAQSVLRCVATLRCGSAVPLKQVQRLLGHMASSAAVTPLGLMHMRPLQHWLRTRVPRRAWHHGTFRVNITPSCRQTLSPWTDIVFLRSGVPLEQVSRRVVVTTDASRTGWGATCNGQAASGVWAGPRLHWHINCLELLAVLLALRRFWPMIQNKHVLVRSDNMATVAYINHQGGVRSFRMSQLARHLLLWSQHRLRSLRATHIPGDANRVADSLSRQVSLGGEWRLHPQSVQLIWDRFGQAQVDLFASPESTHCQLWYGLTEAPLGIDALAHSWPKDRLKYAFPPVSLIAQTLCKVREDKEQVLLVAPFWPNRTWFSDLVLLASAPPWRIPLRKDLLSQGKGTIWHPRPISGTSTCGPWTRPGGLQRSPTISGEHTHSGKSSLYQAAEGLDRHLSASTLKVHGAISANHDLVGGRSVGKHDLVIRFLRGARRLNPPRPHLIPSWDLAVVLRGLQQGPFEPLQSVKLDALSLKTALLTALASVKRVGDLQALSINSSCLEFGPADSHVVLRPRPGYVPKVPTTPFRDQVVTLQAISSQEDDPNLTLLCPVRALRIYLERTQPFRRSEQLFVCYGGQQKGKAVSKQRISHWLVDAIRVAYQARGLPCPLEVRAHSTRGVAASAALANGASLTDICRAAACFKALPLTVITLLSFSRFPSVNPGHHLHHWHLWTWQSFAEGLATTGHKGLSLVVSPGVSPTSAPMFNVVTCTPPVGQVVNSVAPFFLRGGGAFPTLARHSAALLRKARLQNPGTGQSWTLDGHGGGELHFVNTLPVTSALITRDAASKVAVFYGDP